MIYPINPCPAPRQVRSDAWNPRPRVLRYRSFRDEVKSLGVTLQPAWSRIIFRIPMPASWSEKKKAKFNGCPHESKPDLDNLIKALLDACYKEDSHIWCYTAMKLWAEHGYIEIIDT